MEVHNFNKWNKLDITNFLLSENILIDDKIIVLGSYLKWLSTNMGLFNIDCKPEGLDIPQVQGRKPEGLDIPQVQGCKPEGLDIPLVQGCKPEGLDIPQVHGRKPEGLDIPVKILFDI